MTFRVGMKVECIDASGTACVRLGAVYGVVGVRMPYLDLAKLEPEASHNAGMFASRFRPLVERKTDAEVEKLKKLLNPKNHKQFEDCQS